MRPSVKDLYTPRPFTMSIAPAALGLLKLAGSAATPDAVPRRVAALWKLRR